MSEKEKVYFCRFCGYKSWRQWGACPSCQSSVPLKEW